MNNNKGFSLLELLITVAITGILIIAITLLFSEQKKQSDYIIELSYIDSTGKSMLDFLASEIRNAGAATGPGGAIAFSDGGGNGADSITIYRRDIDDFLIGNIPPVLYPPSAMNLVPPLLTIDAPLLSSQQENGDNIYLSLRSPQNLCGPSDCNLNPNNCSECIAIYNATVISTIPTRIDATITNTVVISNFNANDPNEFNRKISNNVVEMGMVKKLEFQIQDRLLGVEENDDGTFLPIGGYNSGGEGTDVGVEDLQFVFHLDDGSIVGTGTNSIIGSEHKIRSVDIFLVLSSRWRVQGNKGPLDPQEVPAIANVGRRIVDTSSSPPPRSLEMGYIYRVFRTSVYLRNFS